MPVLPTIAVSSHLPIKVDLVQTQAGSDYIFTFRVTNTGTTLFEGFITVSEIIGQHNYARHWRQQRKEEIVRPELGAISVGKYIEFSIATRSWPDEFAFMTETF